MLDKTCLPQSILWRALGEQLSFYRRTPSSHVTRTQEPTAETSVRSLGVHKRYLNDGLAWGQSPYHFG